MRLPCCWGGKANPEALLLFQHSLSLHSYLFWRVEWGKVGLWTYQRDIIKMKDNIKMINLNAALLGEVIPISLSQNLKDHLLVYRFVNNILVGLLLVIVYNLFVKSQKSLGLVQQFRQALPVGLYFSTSIPRTQTYLCWDSILSNFPHPVQPQSKGQFLRAPELSFSPRPKARGQFHWGLTEGWVSQPYCQVQPSNFAPVLHPQLPLWHLWYLQVLPELEVDTSSDGFLFLAVWSRSVVSVCFSYSFHDPWGWFCGSISNTLISRVSMGSISLKYLFQRSISTCWGIHLPTHS